MTGVALILTSVVAFMLFAAFGMLHFTREFWRERDFLGLGISFCFWLMPLGAALALIGI